MIRSLLPLVFIFLACVAVTLFVRFLFPSLPIPLVLPAVIVIAYELPHRKRHTGSTVLIFATIGGLSLEVISSAPPGYYFVTTLIFAEVLLVLVQRGILRDSSAWVLASLMSVLVIQHVLLCTILISTGSLALSIKSFVSLLVSTTIFGTVVGVMFRAIIIRYITYEQASLS